MSVQIEPVGCGSRARSVRVELTRGDRLALSVRVDGTASASAAARLAALTGVDWLAQVRETPDAADPVAEFSVTESVVDDVGTWVFVIDDTADLEAGNIYYFDLQVASGDLAPYTYLAGSTIYVTPDVSREVGS